MPEKGKKLVLVTGANKGIGFEIAKQCGEAGFHVIISGRSEAKLEEALGKLRKMNIGSDLLVMDVSDETSIERAAQKFSQLSGGLDVLVNNAGILLPDDRSLLESDPGLLKQTISTNSYGPLLVTRHFLRFMKPQGRIIMISSTGGSLSREVGGWSPAYCVSKTLLNAISRQLAYELRSRKISVNSVSPGWVRTEMGGALASRSVEKGAETPVWLATEAPESLTGRFLSDKSEIGW